MLLVLLGCACVLGACGTQGVQIAKDSPYHRGAVLFRDHCSGCHTLSLVGAQGSATSIANRVKTNGPNFNIRKENAEQVLYAIRNGSVPATNIPQSETSGEAAGSTTPGEGGSNASTTTSTTAGAGTTTPGTGGTGAKAPAKKKSKTGE